MRLVTSLDVFDSALPGRIELLVGDLAETPPEFSSDALVVSAFPDDYTPTRTSLIGALHRKGVSVAECAAGKAEDLRANYGCWISAPLKGTKIPFGRIVCFESGNLGRAPEFVGELFRGLEAFAFGPANITSVSLPLLATGNQGYDVQEMSSALLRAAWNRMREGHPIRLIRIVTKDDGAAQIAAKAFATIAGPASGSISAGTPIWTEDLFGNTPKPRPSAPRSDVFVSYSRCDREAARVVAKQLEASGLSVFIDERSIDPGSSWQHEIFEALENCQAAVVVYSPDFLQSAVCKDEFAAAMILRRRKGADFIFPLLVRSTNLPAYMEMLNYTDCCVSDPVKLTAAARNLATRMATS